MAGSSRLFVLLSAHPGVLESPSPWGPRWKHGSLESFAPWRLRGVVVAASRSATRTVFVAQRGSGNECGGSERVSSKERGGDERMMKSKIVEGKEEEE